jgi:Spy/CpxP family protein refolding chaperone
MSTSSRIRTAFLSLGVVTLSAIVPAMAADPPAKPATAPASAAHTARPHAPIEEYVDLLADLNLTPEQKTKIDAIAAKTHEEFKANAAKKDADIKEVRSANQASYNEMKKEINEVLTHDQHVIVAAKIRHITLGQKKTLIAGVVPKLTAEQEKTVDGIIDDTEKKLDKLDAERIKSGTDVHEKEVEVAKAMQEQLTAALSPEQLKSIEPKK